jgi:hypothetical protein
VADVPSGPSLDSIPHYTNLRLIYIPEDKTLHAPLQVIGERWHIQYLRIH